MTWVIDSTHSQLEFSVKYMMLSNVRGHFAKYDGAINIDEQNPANSTVELNIEAASIDTKMPMREGHLKSPDFFDVENHPIITFRSTRVEPSGDHFKVVGDLTIKGITREVVAAVDYEGQIKDMMGNQRRAFTLKSSISRKDFGLAWNVALEAGGFAVGDTVKIDGEIQLLTKETVDAMNEARRAQAVAAA